MEEIWKDIEGYEGLYQISNLGRVRSLDRYMKNGTSNQYIRKGKILIQQKGTGNYIQVCLSKNCKGKCYKLHRLVAEAFIPNIENKPDINHIDGNKSNNCANNLEWCTKSENMKHAARTGLFVPYNKGKRGKECHSSKKVAMIDKDTGKILRYFDSEKEGALFLGKNDKSNISSCCQQRSKTAYGYKWKIIEGNNEI